MGGVLTILLLVAYVSVTKRFAIWDFRLNKYPPTIYYAMYGVLVFYVLQAIFQQEFVNIAPHLMKVFEYVSRNSFDIYLWHIFALFITETVTNRWLRLPLVVAISVALAFLYRKSVKGLKTCFERRMHS